MHWNSFVQRLIAQKSAPTDNPYCLFLCGFKNQKSSLMNQSKEKTNTVALFQTPL